MPQTLGYQGFIALLGIVTADIALDHLNQLLLIPRTLRQTTVKHIEPRGTYSASSRFSEACGEKLCLRIGVPRQRMGVRAGFHGLVRACLKNREG